MSGPEDNEVYRTEKNPCSAGSHNWGGKENVENPKKKLEECKNSGKTGSLSGRTERGEY